MANATKSKNKKPNWFRRVGAKFKETFSEVHYGIKDDGRSARNRRCFSRNRNGL